MQDRRIGYKTQGSFAWILILCISMMVVLDLEQRFYILGCLLALAHAQCFVNARGHVLDGSAQSGLFQHRKPALAA
ncbi:MAG: hypothetical protein U1E13_03295 [Methylophilaceae bacterium]|nr:hypothetical protein [Methylophilaceae bacterium]